MSTQGALTTVRKDLATLQAKAKNLIISSKQSFDYAAEYVGTLKRMKAVVEDQRKSEVGPLNEQVKEINVKYKGLEVEIDSVLNPISRTMGEYDQKVRAEEAARKAAEEKAYQVQLAKAEKKGTVAPPPPIPSAPPPERKAHTAAGTVSMRVVPKFQVIDPTKVPREWLMVDETRIGKAVRAGLVTEIPGVRIWKESTPVGS